MLEIKKKEILWEVEDRNERKKNSWEDFMYLWQRRKGRRDCSDIWLNGLEHRNNWKHELNTNKLERKYHIWCLKTFHKLLDFSLTHCHLIIQDRKLWNTVIKSILTVFSRQLLERNRRPLGNLQKFGWKRWRCTENSFEIPLSEPSLPTFKGSSNIHENNNTEEREFTELKLHRCWIENNRRWKRVMLYIIRSDKI